jgi:perosamine synthetase
VGRVHLDRLEEFIGVRRRVAGRYDAALSAAPGLAVTVEPQGVRSNYYKYPVLLDAGLERARFKARMRDDFDVVCSGEVYATPLHHEPVFAAIDTAPGPGALAGAEDVCARHVCLPVHSDMTDAEADQVAAAALAVAADLLAG